ncbi:ROK family protein [Candidatus Sumerlaeota bacterium]|nr:ROK family protein [Candidatus Sumerlaeota bacterium]
MTLSDQNDAAVYVGLDIGGTKFLVASADAQCRILDRIQEPTPQSLDDGLNALNRMIALVSKGRKITSMGAAIGGPLDWKKGIVSPLHQPEWRDVPLKTIMEERWKSPFFVDVDTNVAALGEYHFGDERAPRFLYLTLSTGMGGGFLIDGKIFRGMDGGHPEIGHQSINFQCSYPERVVCECGAGDCLEALVSGNGIRRIYEKPAEKLSQQEWEEVAYNLGQGLRNLSAVYLPDVIVLGGGVAIGGGEPLLAAAVKQMEKRLHIVPAPQVRLSRLGHDTALLGAIAIALHGLD